MLDGLKPFMLRKLACILRVSGPSAPPSRSCSWVLACVCAPGVSCEWKHTNTKGSLSAPCAAPAPANHSSCCGAGKRRWTTRSPAARSALHRSSVRRRALSPSSRGCQYVSRCPSTATVTTSGATTTAPASWGGNGRRGGSFTTTQVAPAIYECVLGAPAPSADAPRARRPAIGRASRRARRRPCSWAST